MEYLDLHIEIKESGLYYTLYDKRDKFPFPIVNFPTYLEIFQQLNLIMYLQRN